MFLQPVSNSKTHIIKCFGVSNILARQREALTVACRGPAFPQREEVSQSAIVLTKSAKALRWASSVNCQSAIQKI
jgi:hypothetical protein